MTKLYRKNELIFALLWIVLYVVLTSAGDNLSQAAGVEKSGTLILHLAMTAALFLWIRKNGLVEKYGLCRGRVPARRFLYYLPLAVIASLSLWTGITLRYSLLETALFVLSMLCVGFLEEVIFRGLLFRALEKNGVKKAVIISAVTFGLGHIVNLINGSGSGLSETLLQIFFAVLVGFILVLIFYRGGSLIPCIVFHGLNNAISAFGAEGGLTPRQEMLLNLAIIVVLCGGYLLYLLRAFSEKTA